MASRPEENPFQPGNRLGSITLAFRCVNTLRYLSRQLFTKRSCLLVLVLAACIPFPAVCSAQELRGLWVDAFAQGIKSPDQIDLLLRRAQAGGFNALFVQVRKSGDAYYQSRYEPWANDNRQRFDALAAVIAKAHALNPPMQVHAWMNACAVGRHRDNRYHVTLAHPEYTSLSVSGEDHDGEAKKIDPGNPDAAELTFRVALDIARHYDVDGIQLDFIRYGGQRWGYSPANVQRFNTRYRRTGKPQPKDPLWMQWRRDQVTGLVRKIYAYCNRIKPKLVVSAATICWMESPTSLNDWAFKSAAMNRTFQDWRAWMREGIIDLNCTMSYSNERRHPDWFRGWAAFATGNQFNRRAAIGIGGWLNTRTGATNQLIAARKPIGGKRPLGVVLYCYNELLEGAPEAGDRVADELADWQVFRNASEHVSIPPFAKPMIAPVLPWKQSRKTGNVMGTILTADGLKRVDGALVTLTSGRTVRRVRTDGTGFFAFVDVLPAHMKLHIHAPGMPDVRREFDVESGGTHLENAFVGKSSTETVTNIEEWKKLEPGSQARVIVRVNLGSDIWEQHVAGMLPSGDSIPIRFISNLRLPLQESDVAAISGWVKAVGSQRWLDADSAELVDVVSSRTVRLSLSSALQAHPGVSETQLTMISGHVSEPDADGFWLNGEQRVWVELGGRKGPGIEDIVTDLQAPPSGRSVSVTGNLVKSPMPNGNVILTLVPRNASDVLELPPSLRDRWRLSIVLALAILGSTAGFVYWRIRRRSRPPS